MNWAIFFLLISLNSHASIFGKDDRVDTRFTDAQTQELARSVPALIPKERVLKVGDKFHLTGYPLKEFGLCSDETFAAESNIANCSASLIAPDKVLTAGHCFNERNTCDSYNIVFDYQLNDDHKYVMNQDQVFNCKRIVYYNYDLKDFSVDLAIIELDRIVIDREPVKLSTKLSQNESLFMIGYPMGISQKVVEQGKVLSIDQKNVSFKSDLDSFSVNSGGPIFNTSFEQVGVLVRGTGPNFDKYNNENCYRWQRDESGQGFSDGNDLTLLPSSYLNQH